MSASDTPYPFHLEKHPKQKGPCPQCGYPKKFRYYEDLNGNRLEDFGICERKNECGYHVWPTGKSVPKTEGEYIPPPLPVQIYPDAITLKKLATYQADLSSNLHAYCRSLGIPDEHLIRWRVGTDYNKNTVYVFEDVNGLIVNAKWFTYLPTGKRDKARDSFSIKQPERPKDAPADQPVKRYSMCIYGEHLLSSDKAKWVMLVESEKTAVVASHFYPMYDWLAVGSANGLTDAKIAVLYGRKIAWLADADGNQPIPGKDRLSEGGRRNSSLRKLTSYQQNFCVLDLFPQAKDGSDIADALAVNITPDLDALLQQAVTQKETDITNIVVFGSPDYQLPTPEPAPQEPAVPNADPNRDLTPELVEAVNQDPPTGTDPVPPPQTAPTPDKSVKAKRNSKHYDPDDDGELWVEETVRYHTGSTSILVKGMRGWNVVARGFQLYICYMTLDEYENQMWIIEIRPNGDRASIFIEMTHDDFSTVSRFKRLILAKAFSLQLSESELSRLQEFMFQLGYKEAIKIIRYGYHRDSRVFFFANAAIYHDQVLTPNEFQIVETDQHCLVMPTTQKKGIHPFTLTQTGLTFNDWFELYRQAHLYENCFIPACFYLMALYRDVMLAHKPFSPILFAKGAAGSGKSSLIRNLTCLFGFKPKEVNLKSKNTAAALVKLMSQSSNVITQFEEFYNDFEHEGLLQAAYDNAGYHLSGQTGTTETVEVDIKSALALTSNFTPKNDIFFQRCLFIPVNANTKTPEQVIAFRRLNDLEDLGLACVTVEMLKHRAIIEANYHKRYNELYKAMTAAVPTDTPQRMKENMVLCMTVPYLLNMAQLIKMTDAECEEDILAEFVAMGKQAILRQSVVQLERSALSEFFAILQQLYDEKKLISPIHFRFEGQLIHLRLSQLFTTFKQKYRQVYFADSPDRDSIITELEILTNTRPGKKAGENLFKPIRFAPDEHESKAHARIPIQNSCSIDYNLIRDRFGVDFTAQD